MTNGALNFCRRAIVYFTFLVWAIAAGSRASEPARAGQSAPPAAIGSPLVLTNAEQVHWLTRPEAAAGRPVRIRGVITCALPKFNAAVVQDRTAGIYVYGWLPSLGGVPQMGEVVEVEGITDPGQFAPRVDAKHINRLGTGELPAPVHPYWDQLINGSLDTEFVEMEGVATTVRADGVTLLTHGGKIKVLVFGVNGETNNLALKPCQDALIRLRGCLFASWDETTHEVKVSEVCMYAPLVTVVEPPPADPFAVTPKQAADLLQFDPRASALRQVKISGHIIARQGREFYAMDGTNGFRFILKENANLGAGDLVEVVGFPALTGPSPVLQEALARKTGVAPVPNARPLDADNLFRAENDAVRVRVEAVLLSLSEDQRTLELQTGLQRFVARLEGGGKYATPRRVLSAAGLDLPPGSRLELTGIYAGNGGNRTTHAQVVNFELLLNSPADIRVLARPPFWTLPRLLVLVGALLGVLGLALIWIRLLHHRVQQRTVQLEKEMHEREQAEHQRALAQERARIARDLHDDLGSSLTEITMLATTGPGLKLPAEEAAERMGTIAGKSRTLVNALDEIVWAVDPARDTLASVARYLASYAEEYLAGLKVACRVHIPNSFPDQAVSGEVRHHLFLAVKEALNNAVRHGGATEIGFHVRVLADQLGISITDNGGGFEAAGRSNGHGLLNLRNRLEQLHGRCDLESSPGAGTTVSLQVPLPVPNHLP
ncbi:MAG TPA: sensor histidine kinase [Candidatus Sulfopaludibacter sp.]|nr:sensor histidine kinase [Candidatus Sulfopaludibacter sp.]